MELRANPTPAKSLSERERIIPIERSAIRFRFAPVVRDADHARPATQYAPTMAVPRYTWFIQPILRYLAQHESAVATAEVYEAAANELGLSENDRAAQMADGVPVYRNRASWGLNWLKRAGLAESPAPTSWRLTPSGRQIAAADAMPLDKLLLRFADRVEARRSAASKTEPKRSLRVTASPTPGARGNRKAYRLPARPLARGGQADVYEAVRKSDNRLLVLKRARGGPDPRMRREIQVQSSLQHPNVMPILDWDTERFSWYVMPKGTRTMSELPRPIDTVQLLEILDSVLAALEASHSAGNPHRDVKPPNVVEVQDEGGETRWVLADWGLTRRAPGATTARHTKPEEFLGSEGFAPPEAYRNAHDVGIPGDIYALGQLIAWATGVDPVPNVSPTVQGPWQRVVELATQQEPARRLQSIAEVREQIAAVRAPDAGEEAPLR